MFFIMNGLKMLMAALVGILITTAHADPVPTRSATPELGPSKIPHDILRCERNNDYKNQAYPCDSPVSADGEGLKRLLQTVPAAQKELELYQENRRSREITAYTGMAGIVLATLVPRFFEQKHEKNTFIAVGLTMTLGSLAYGKSRLNENEHHLSRAISYFNEANPDAPITLKGQ
jgi:hypothetical protein